MFEVEDDERRRFAQELRDTIAQDAVALTMDLGLIINRPGLPSEVRSVLSESLFQARQNLQEIMMFCHQLYPLMLDELGLVWSLKVYVEGLSRTSGIRVELALPDAYLGLSRDLEVTLHRIVCVELNAARRHFNSSWSRVRLSMQATEVRLTIENELGIEPSFMKAPREPREPGLRSVQERTRQLGGRIRINSDEHRILLEAVFPFSTASTAAGA